MKQLEITLQLKAMPSAEANEISKFSQTLSKLFCEAKLFVKISKEILSIIGSEKFPAFLRIESSISKAPLNELDPGHANCIALQGQKGIIKMTWELIKALNLQNSIGKIIRFKVAGRNKFVIIRIEE